MVESDKDLPFLKHIDEDFEFKRTLIKFKNKHPYKHLKDACPVFDGSKWHLYGTGDTRLKGDKGKKGWVEVIHATSDSADGPWQVNEGVKLHGLTGPHPCAPGVVYDFIENAFYMFIHTSFVLNGGTIECLKSTDGGHSFYHVNSIVKSLPSNDEARIYDPHPAIINGDKYIIYTSCTEDNVFSFRIVKSINGSWVSEWEKLGQVLHEKEVFFQNQPGSLGREWGIEGAQVIELPNKKILMNAVCFLPESPSTPPGKKQRFFLAIADNVLGPYKLLGPVLTPTKKGWESGENGHATVIIENEELKFFYHARHARSQHPMWKFGVASCNVQKVLAYS